MGGLAQAARVFGSDEALGSRLESLNAAVFAEAPPETRRARGYQAPRYDDESLQ